MSERDSKGKFVKGHKAYGDMSQVVEYNKKFGVWNKGKKGVMPEQTEEVRKQKSKKMQDHHKRPIWDEQERQRKISKKLKGHEVSEKTREKLRITGRRGKKQGTNFEYRALHFMEKVRGVVEVIRGAGSKGIDLTVIWENGNSFLISKEEVKSSLRWYKTISKNPLTLLDKDDKRKLISAYEKGFEIFLIYREPKIKIDGGIMEKQSHVKRIKLSVEKGQIVYDEFKIHKL